MTRPSCLLLLLLSAHLCLGTFATTKTFFPQETDSNRNSKDEVTRSSRSFSFARHFDDHMVLQRSPAQAVVHGFHPNVGSKVYLRMVADSKSYYYTSTVTPSPDWEGGVWSVTLDPMASDVTAVIEAVSQLGSLTIRDVIFGDVWICSGQSNMEFTVSMMYGAQEEIDNAHNYPKIRLMTTSRTHSDVPLYDLKPLEQTWIRPSAESIGGKEWTYFSAVCWLFGKGIHQATGIPIGLIDSDWGGSPLAGWSSPDALAMCNRTVPLPPPLPPTEFGYLSGQESGDQNLLHVNEQKSEPDMRASSFWNFYYRRLEAELYQIEEMVKLKRPSFRPEATTKIKAKAQVTEKADTILSSRWFEDNQYFPLSGRRERSKKRPHPHENSMEKRAPRDQGEDGQIAPRWFEDDEYLHKSRRVKSDKRSIPRENQSDRRPSKGQGKDKQIAPHNDDMAPQNDTILWNAMIHPLLQTAIKGVVWYQGETDANSKHLKNIYNCTFPAMIRDWRSKFHKASGGSTDPQFPFGFVQLAPSEKHPVNATGFEDIRWHQTADYGYTPNPMLQNVFMAVAIDLPDFHSAFDPIHPRHKKDIGHRLALAGLSVVYNQPHVFQGPLPVSGESVSFTFVLDYGNAWTLRIKNFDGFEFYCSGNAMQGEWMPTSILAWDDTTVTLYYGSVCGSGRASRLRYLWHTSPCEFKQCPVYSVENDLPAPPFIADLFTDHRGILRASFNHTLI